MKVLLDNNVPKKLRRALFGHEVHTAYEMGWHQLQNGKLLTAGEGAHFGVMITGDKNMLRQQDFSGRAIHIILLSEIDWRYLRHDTQKVANAVNSSQEIRFQFVLIRRPSE